MEKINVNDYSVQTLLSVLGVVDIKSLIKQIKIKDNYVVINQIPGRTDKILNEDPLHRIVQVGNCGLSRSRNLAINNCISDIAIFSDDDMEYCDDYVDVIKKTYKKYPDATAIAFIVEYDNKKNKKPLKEGRLGFLRSFKISSVQLTINVKKILKNNIEFDENFGAGSRFPMGEENIFLSDIYKKRLKIYYVPIKIGTLKSRHGSSWFKGYNEDYFIARGAGYYRMSSFMWRLLILQFAIRKYKLYSGNMSRSMAIRNMVRGAREYKKEYCNV